MANRMVKILLGKGIQTFGLHSFWGTCRRELYSDSEWDELENLEKEKENEKQLCVHRS